jgi:hypothetical protein
MDQVLVSAFFLYIVVACSYMYVIFLWGRYRCLSRPDAAVKYSWSLLRAHLGLLSVAAAAAVTYAFAPYWSLFAAVGSAIISEVICTVFGVHIPTKSLSISQR